MKLTAAFLSFPLLLSSILAPALAISVPSPALSKRADNITAPYYLKTKTLDRRHRNKDGLYVWAYHTGAGLNDAVLGSKDYARPAYLNNSVQVFDLGTEFPWSFTLASDTNYAGWEPVSIDVGYGTSGLFLNASGLQWTEYGGFGGWLACDWFHGLPQLFWKVEYVNYNISTCARVLLVTEAVDA
ncbi:hypothetical protein G7Y79_00004g014820 [Physcia stellaris]|nr:hypothetical protein G7Y79_00004g014820 [Physcia stellaris]